MVLIIKKNCEKKLKKKIFEKLNYKKKFHLKKLNKQEK